MRSTVAFSLCLGVAANLACTTSAECPPSAALSTADAGPPTACSVAGEESRTLRLENKTSCRDYEVFWISPQCEPMSMGDLRVGGFMQIQTSNGESFRIIESDTGAFVLDLVVSDDTPRTFDVPE